VAKSNQFNRRRMLLNLKMDKKRRNKICCDQLTNNNEKNVSYIHAQIFLEDLSMYSAENKKKRQVAKKGI
jgi:hypothetical protein